MLRVSDFDDNAWTKLTQGNAEPHFVPGLQLTYEGVVEPYVCILRSNDGSAHLLIAPDHPLTEDLVRPEVAGLQISLLQNYQVVGRDRQTYIDVRCQYQSDIHLFTIIAREIATMVLQYGAKPSLAVNSTIRLWRRFWRRPATRILEEWEQIGLISELVLLQQLLQVHYPKAVDCWTGPLGQRHDFNLEHVAFEAKATADHQRKHLINGIYQLEPPAGRKLAVVSVLFAKLSSGGFSLPDQVALVLKLLEAAVDEIDTFWTRLALTGYTPEHAEHYEQARFTYTSPQVFPVTPDFPGITPDRFTHVVSPRVSSVQYLLDFEGLPCYGFDSDLFNTLLA